MRAEWIVGLALALWIGGVGEAWAVPGFARQTGQPCSACHVGAFGPQLTPYGRQFKLNGYVQENGDNQFPVAAMAQLSFTHTRAPQDGGAAPGFSPNDNAALEQVSIFFAGRITDTIGAFFQTTYDGVGKSFAWDNLDVRYAKPVTLAGKPLILGVTVNNNPTVQDPWNSTPAWSFPFAQGGLVPTPGAATAVDGAAAQTVIGAGGYVLWNDLIYAEADIYTPLGRSLRRFLGVPPAPGDTKISDPFPYWRVALEHDFGKHTLEVGTFGMSEHVYPGGDKSAGADRLTDLAVDASYMFTGDDRHRVTGYVTYIHEHQALQASRTLLDTRATDSLDTLRVSGSYSWQNTITVSGQHFTTFGSADPALYADTGRPNSRGWVGEIAWVPSGKPGSRFPTWLNARVSLQYTAYNEFDGLTAGAPAHNTLFLLLWLAF